MARVSISKKTIKSTLNNKDIISMFQDTLGGVGKGYDSLHIVYPKYIKIKTDVKRIITIISTLHNSDFMLYFPEMKLNLEKYLSILNKQFSENFDAPDLKQFVITLPPVDLSSSTEDYTKAPIELVELFHSKFAAVKKCNIINLIILLCKNLTQYKVSLKNLDKLSDKFLLNNSSLAPLPELSSFNFKHIYIDDRLNKINKSIILTCLSKLYTISNGIYEAITTPDVDVSEFTNAIMESINEVKKHIPRCNDAFNKILDSVDLLKSNFGEYYKDYTSSGNPTIIMENFVLDVSKNTKSSPGITRQFREIIKYYKKMAGENGAIDPKVQTLFNHVEANYNELEKAEARAEAETKIIIEEVPEEPIKKEQPKKESNTLRNRRKKDKKKLAKQAQQAQQLPNDDFGGEFVKAKESDSEDIDEIPPSLDDVSGLVNEPQDDNLASAGGGNADSANDGNINELLKSCMEMLNLNKPEDNQEPEQEPEQEQELVGDDFVPDNSMSLL